MICGSAHYAVALPSTILRLSILRWALVVPLVDRTYIGGGEPPSEQPITTVYHNNTGHFQRNFCLSGIVAGSHQPPTTAPSDDSQVKKNTTLCCSRNNPGFPDHRWPLRGDGMVQKKIPELSWDSDSNVFYCDTDGHWRPHNGPLPPFLSNPFGQIQSSTTPSGLISMHDKSHGGPDAPIEHTFQDQYQFSLWPVQSGGSQHPIPIDPALISLPDGTDLNLTHGPTVAKAMGVKPVGRIAGSRRKGKEPADPKGKKRQRGCSGSEDDSEPAAKRGRPDGSGNYHKEDTDKLLDLGWKEIYSTFNRWAVLNGRTKRSQKSLENKFKQYLKAKKPTGNATCPPEIKRAHETEDLINTHVGTRDLSDSEFHEESDKGSSNDDIEVIEHPSASVRTAVARRAPTPPLRRESRAGGADLANKLAHAFDPAVQQARDDQLRDSQAVVESLRTQNTILQNHVHELEHACDRAEVKLELLNLNNGSNAQGRSRPRPYKSHKRVSDIERVRGKIRCETKYPGGGAMTHWISDPSTDDYEDYDEEKENSWDTFDYQRRSRSRHTTSYRAVSRRRTPTPSPSRIRRASLTSDTRAASMVMGNAVQLVVTPHRGPAIALVISPTPKQV
ncbi:hypothetical protein C8J57DRAFT_1222969 [Mycena rebaudengoi]|nr:hypothetical protein C8J57DRAFT_1222969 [Mycena rebaudengoi]